jgi:hypothetical protein
MTSLPKTSFGAGEIAPALYGRTDLDRYYAALRICQNFIVLRSGGVTNRPGTRAIKSAKCNETVWGSPPVHDEYATRLIPFVFSDDQTYVLELGERYLRIYRSGVSLEFVAGDVPAWGAGTTYAAGAFVSKSGLVFRALQGANLNHDPVSGAPWWINDETVEVVTPYLQTELFDLQYTQSADVMTVVHALHPPMELARYSDTDWRLTEQARTPTVPPPASVTVIGAGGAGGATPGGIASRLGGDGIWPSFSNAEGTKKKWAYQVTTVSPEGRESLPTTSPTDLETVMTSDSPNTVEWDYPVFGATWSGATTYVAGDLVRYPFDGFIYRSLQDGNLNHVPSGGAPWWEEVDVTAELAASYNVYRARNGTYGYIGTKKSDEVYPGATGKLTFIDDDIVPIYTDTPPTWEDPFDAADKYPSVVAYFQQRLCLAATNGQPETVWMSRSGDYHNFGTSSPPKDDDRIQFTIAAGKVQRIMHLIPLRQLIALTEAGEWLVVGGADEIVTPATTGLRAQGFRGASKVPPVLIGESAVFVQRKGSVVRDLNYSLEQDAFVGQDLSVMSSHLFDGHRIVDWAYAQVPFSVVWAVREDGVLLGFTYMREQQIWAWHRHTTDGLVKSVCVVSEEGEDVLYVLVQRNISTAIDRDFSYIERLQSRAIADFREDPWFVDAGVRHDGFAQNAGALTLSVDNMSPAGTPFTVGASGALFAGSQVGDLFVFRNGGDWIRCRITQVLSTSQAAMVADKDLNEDQFPTPADGTWAKGISSLATPFFGTVGTPVVLAVFADGFSQGRIGEGGTGTIQLAEQAVYVIAGLPIDAELETLDLALAQTSIRDREKVVGKVCVQVENSMGLWVGPRGHEAQFIPRDGYGDLGDPQPITDLIEVRADTTWNKGGRVVVQQRDPLPLTVLAIIPEVTVAG